MECGCVRGSSGWTWGKCSSPRGWLVNFSSFEVENAIAINVVNIRLLEKYIQDHTLEKPKISCWAQHFSCFTLPCAFWKASEIHKISQLKAYKKSILDTMLFWVISQCRASPASTVTLAHVQVHCPDCPQPSPSPTEVGQCQGYEWASVLRRRPISTTP